MQELWDPYLIIGGIITFLSSMTVWLEGRCRSELRVRYTLIAMAASAAWPLVAVGLALYVVYRIARVVGRWARWELSTARERRLKREQEAFDRAQADADAKQYNVQDGPYK